MDIFGSFLEDIATCSTPNQLRHKAIRGLQETIQSSDFNCVIKQAKDTLSFLNENNMDKELQYLIKAFLKDRQEAITGESMEDLVGIIRKLLCLKLGKVTAFNIQIDS